MAEEILFGIAEEILKNLASKALDEIALAWGFKDRLDKLQETVNTIKCVLLDAEEKQADSNAIHDWLKRLATVVYAADDLFDEVATIASRKQIMGENKLTRKVKTFFSSSNQVVLAFRISRKIKTIREKLDDIFRDSAVFSFECRSHEEGSLINIRRGRDQTYSYVDANEVIGRDDDKEAILKSLLACSEIEDKALQVISIVGIGGQGKTTLAQCIYNDSQADKYFDLKLWVCVSEDFNIKVIAENILELTSDVGKGLQMEKLQGLLRNKLNDKRYLLVLDDVWNEEREKWLKLEDLLKNGRKGSKVLVTARSKKVANIMGSAPYELEGLLEEKAWELFQKLAFTPEQLQQKPHIMMKAGEEIVKKCANVPLAIRSVAGLLYGSDESKWMSFKDRNLANIFEGQNDTMNILKLSYQHLPSPLKNCFIYCALYPKDYEFDKEKLIDLWMAEGFIVPTNQEVQVEELAEDYFFVLLQRCFFQDVKEDEVGNIKSCKMHDLVHDLAQQMAKLRCKVAESEDSNSNKEIHHLSLAYRLTSQWEPPSWMLDWKALRTFLLPQQVSDRSPFRKSICRELISSFSCLRVLDLHAVEVKSLPSSIGKLIHLRYLDLSQTCIRKLPGSIIKLHNLQTLRLYNCPYFSALPRKIRKLNKLRILDVRGCGELNHMPLGLGELTSLTKLPRFMVNNNIHYPSSKSKPKSARMSDLKILDLRGDLLIAIEGELRNPLFEAAEANLCGKQGLTKLCICLDRSLNGDDSGIEHDEGLLEGLKPHLNLKSLEIARYRGRKLPSWAMNNLSINLPNLVKVELWHCDLCEQVPSFGCLPLLKHLWLYDLSSVEYMEMDDLSLFPNSSSMEPFFPSLENLTLIEMSNLKGWWKVGATVDDDTKEERCLSISFPKLSNLDIFECPKLISFPLCPNVEKLSLIDVNRSISVSKMAASSSASESGSKLKMLTVSNVGDLMSLPRECLHQLSELIIEDKNLESIDEIEDEVFTSLSSSLRTLQFIYCRRLRYLGQGLEHLTAMEKLVIIACSQLDLSQNEEVPWKSFTSLRSLKLDEVDKMLSLPSGLQHLTNLHSLEISCNKELKELPEWISGFSSLGYLKLYYCPNLTSLPDGFRKLTSLNQLEIIDCPKLTKRCRAPNGADWHKINHIPLLCWYIYSVMDFITKVVY